MKKLSRLSRVSLMLAVLFGVDKILGVLRQMLISRQFRLSAELDVFNAANNLPDMLFMLISGGALAIAFIPVLTEVLSKEGREKAWKLFSNILNIAFLLTALISIVVAIFARPLISSQLGIAPGFTGAQVDSAVVLMRLNLVATLIFSLSGLVMAGLQANEHFILPALAPIFYDLGQIFGACVLAPSVPYQLGPISLPAFGLGVNGLVYGVILGALLHLLIQVPGLVHYKFKWFPKIDLKDTNTLKVLRLIGPRVASMICIQLIFLVQDNLASRLSAGSVTSLTYGWWIMQVPETLIGTSIATAILPTLSEYFSGNKLENFKQKLERAGQVMLGLTIPIALIAAVIILPLIQTMLGFDVSETLRVGEVTRIFLLGIIGHSLVELFVRAFYAMQKPKYPFLGSVLTLLVYASTAILLSRSLGAKGIALANTIAYSLQAILLLVLLNKTLPKRLLLWESLVRAIIAAMSGGAAAYLIATKIPSIAGSFIGAALAGLVGLIFAALVVRPELATLKEL